MTKNGALRPPQARRLLERGVRFVQLFNGGSSGSPRINWDGHETIKENHTTQAATIPHLLGIDHQKLTFYHNGINRRLTDVHAHVVSPVLS